MTAGGSKLSVRRRKVSYGAYAGVICAGVFLILLAVPVLMAELIRIDNRYTIQQLSHPKQVVDETAIQSALTRTDRALQWNSGSQVLWDDRVALRLGLYERFYASLGPRHVEGRELLETIRTDLIAALSHGPSNSHLWYILSEVDIRLSPHSRSAMSYLKTSYLTGRREGWIASRRLGFALKNWRRLDLVGRSNAYQDLSLLWTEVPFREYLARLFVRAGPLGRSIIYRHVSHSGVGGVSSLRRSLDQIGWKSEKPLLYAVIE